MMTLKRFTSIALTLGVLAGCAGQQRGCQNWQAQTYGADWVVAQIGVDGHPARCWVLRGVSVANESQSDGLHWLSRDGHLVHLAGWIDRVQVSGGDFKAAGAQIGVNDVQGCTR